MLLKVGIEALLLKPFKLKFREMSIFGYRFYKNNDGKWERNGRNPNGLTLAEPYFEVKNASPEELKSLDKRTHTFILVTDVILLVICIAAFIGCLILRENTSLELFRSFLLWFGITFLVRGIVSCIIGIYAIARVSSNTLSGYANRAINQYRAGVPLQTMDLKPEKDLDFKNVKDLDRLLYFPIYFSYCDMCEKFDELAEAVTEYEKIRQPETSTTSDKVNSIYLTYYYSYHNIDPAKAQMYYSRAGKMLDQDKDANGMRIKGFYYLNAMNDIEKARECLSNAESSIDTYSIPVERENERILITRLRKTIEEYNG